MGGPLTREDLLKLLTCAEALQSFLNLEVPQLRAKILAAVQPAQPEGEASDRSRD